MAPKLLFVMLTVAICYGQPQEERVASTEVSLWSQDGGNFAPWVFYRGKRMTAEVRYNWDDKGVLGACIGKSFGNDALKLIPEVCGYSGKFSGYGPELWVESDTKKFFVSSYIQYAKMSGTTSYGYLWFQSDYKLARYLGIGLGAQSLKDGSAPISADLGLSINVKFGRGWYINFTPLWRATREESGQFTNYNRFRH